MTQLRAILDGPPRRWQRAAFIKGKKRTLRSARTARQHVQAVVGIAMMRARLPAWEAGVPLSVEIEAVFKRPKTSKHLDRTDPGRQWYPQVPDLDNVSKLWLDACNGLLWHDDAQVVRLAITKVFAAEGEAPHTLFRCEPHTQETAA